MYQYKNELLLSDKILFHHPSDIIIRHAVLYFTLTIAQGIKLLS